ncbi:pyrroline-5-carboxylate reductase [Marinilabiliaceae bacterium ANBcel2]|nr:pyrroline-5-carboxylate reductase [Marinilabiliaceae bacterium ANBcel2]
MTQHSIAVIGSGNLGSAIIKGLIYSGKYDNKRITVSDKNIEALKSIKKLGVNTTTNNSDAANKGDIIILAVKPYLVKEVINEFIEEIKPKSIIISLAAGVSIKELQCATGTKLTLFRAIPNTAAEVCQSFTSICGVNYSEKELSIISEVFSDIGETEVIPEELMGAATVLASCGTAYAMRFISAASRGGTQMGLQPELAQKMVAQTLRGAAKILNNNSSSHPEQEIDKVTTPGGITITGLNEMEHHNFSSSIIKGLIAAHNKVK